MRYILERGSAMAVGTGADATKVGPYAKENLGIYGFSLTADEMKTLGAIAADAEDEQPVVEASSTAFA